MEPLTFGGGDVSQQRLPDQLVSEDQIPITLDRGNEPCLFGFLEGVDEGIRVHAGHLPDEIRGEPPAGHRPGTRGVAGEGDSRVSRSPTTSRMLSGTDASSTLKFGRIRPR